MIWVATLRGAHEESYTLQTIHIKFFFWDHLVCIYSIVCYSAFSLNATQGIFIWSVKMQDMFGTRFYSHFPCCAISVNLLKFIILNSLVKKSCLQRCFFLNIVYVVSFKWNCRYCMQTGVRTKQFFSKHFLLVQTFQKFTWTQTAMAHSFEMVIYIYPAKVGHRLMPIYLPTGVIIFQARLSAQTSTPNPLCIQINSRFFRKWNSSTRSFTLNMNGWKCVRVTFL